MVIALVIVFVISLSLSFIEDRMIKRDKILSYAIIGFILICIAGSRSIYDTPDSMEYEQMYYQSGGGSLRELADEPTFRFFSLTLRDLGLGINALFFLYAMISVPLHLWSFWKMSKLPLLTLVVYLSYYFQMHDLVQMRCSVASALFLFSIYFYGENKKWYSFACIVIGTLFHYSAVMGLLIFLLNNKEWNYWQRWTAYLLVPVGLIVYYSGVDISYLVPAGLGGNKLDAYRRLKETGIEDDLAGWDLKGNAVIWMNVGLYYGTIIYRNTLSVYCKNIHFYIKILALAFGCLFFLHNISAVLASRLCDYFEVISIILWTVAVYAFYPIIAGKVLINIASTLRFVLSMLFYAMALLTM